MRFPSGVRRVIEGSDTTRTHIVQFYDEYGDFLRSEKESEHDLSDWEFKVYSDNTYVHQSKPGIHIGLQSHTLVYWHRGTRVWFLKLQEPNGSHCTFRAWHTCEQKDFKLELEDVSLLLDSKKKLPVFNDEKEFWSPPYKGYFSRIFRGHRAVNKVQPEYETCTSKQLEKLEKLEARHLKELQEFAEKEANKTPPDQQLPQNISIQNASHRKAVPVNPKASGRS